MRLWRTLASLAVAVFASAVLTAYVTPAGTSYARGGRGGGRGGRGGGGGGGNVGGGGGGGGSGGGNKSGSPKSGGGGGSKGTGKGTKKKSGREGLNGKDPTDYLEALQRETATDALPDFLFGARYDASADAAGDDRDAGLEAERRRASTDLRRASEGGAHPL